MPFSGGAVAGAAGGGVSSALVDAKGDLLTATADDTNARLAVGTNGQILMANSAQSAGLQWTEQAELGYAEAVAAQTQTGAGNVDLTSLSATVTVGIRPIVIVGFVPKVDNSSASGLCTLNIKESATVLTSAYAPLGVYGGSLQPRVRVNPSAGSHTYKLNITQAVTGNTTVTGSAVLPMFIQVIQV